MLFYCFILILLITLFITTFHYRRDEQLHIPHKEHPLKFFYGTSFYILDFIKKHRKDNTLSSRDRRLSDKLSRLYVGILPEKLLLLHKAKIISIILSVVFIFSVLGVIFSISNNSTNNNVTSLPRPTDGNEAATYEITAIIDGNATDITLEIESAAYTLEEAISYFDNHRESIENSLKNRNSNLYEITSDLTFSNKVDGISITWEIENTSYIDYDGHIIMDNIPPEGVMTNIFANLTYKGHSATISIPIYIVKVSTISSINDEIQSQLIIDNDIYDNTVILPAEVDGHKITYLEKKENFYFPFYYVG